MNVRRLCGVLGRPRADHLLLLEALVTLLVARVAIRLVPTRLVLRWANLAVDDTHSRALLSSDDLAPRVGWSIHVAARVVPGTSKCLARAAAAARMIHRAGGSCVLFLGVCRGEDRRLMAHSWLVSGDQVVTGGPHHVDYIPVARYRRALPVRAELSLRN